MEAKDIIYKHKSIFTDDHGAISCPYLEVPDEWLPYLDALFSEIIEHLKREPNTAPMTFYTVSEVRGLLVMDYDGGDEYLEGMLTISSRYSPLWSSPLSVVGEASKSRDNNIL